VYFIVVFLLLYGHLVSFPSLFPQVVVKCK
jgi:hypothetical protein